MTSPSLAGFDLTRRQSRNQLPVASSPTSGQRREPDVQIRRRITDQRSDLEERRPAPQQAPPPQRRNADVEPFRNFLLRHEIDHLIHLFLGPSTYKGNGGGGAGR